MKEIIRLDGIHRNFVVGGETVHALRGVSFTINEGEFVTIMGTSGSGKSTLLNILGCLDTPTSGSYFIDGAEVQKMSRNERAYIRNRKIGFVFQNYNLLPKTTSVENVELPLFYNSAIGAKERRRRAEEALDAVGLHDRMMHKSNQMSGGQQQRVAIARALVNDPVLILADEATGNLDTRTSFSILTLFQQLHSMGRTIIFVTHNPELSDYSSRNIVLRDGKIISDGGTNGLEIAPMMFISLVENAFKHGVSAGSESFIDIRITLDSNRICCHVENSLFPKQKSDKSGSGIGLANLQRQLELLYPESHDYSATAIGDRYVAELSITLNATKD